MIGNYLFLDVIKLKLRTIFSFLAFAVISITGYLSLSDFDLRIFDVAEGIESSIGAKMEWFLKFFNQLDSPLRFIFGHFSSSNIEQYGIPLLDSEWGEAFYNFGLLGSLSIILFYFSIFKTHSKDSRFFLILLLW